MALTYGFFNSLDGDRKYDAKQMSQIFDGILNDGVFQSIGEFFTVKAGTGMQVKVGPGRAWFNSTWTLSDSDIVCSLANSDVTLARYDTVILEVDEDQNVRANSIKVLTGTAATNPTKPALTNNETLHQHPLAHILVSAGATAITAADIEIVVGTSACPFVTGILETADIDDLFAKWDSQFNTWFENVQAQLSGDVATNLQKQIDDVLKPATKAMFGLSEDAIPDDAFKILGKYTQYWWRRRTHSVVETRTDISATVDLTSNSNSQGNFEYSKSISIDSNGNIILVDPVTLDGVASASNDATRLGNTLQPYLDDTPYYVTSDKVNGKIYYIPAGSSIIYDGGNTDYFAFGLYRYSSKSFYMVLSKQTLPEEGLAAQLVTGDVQLGTWEYIQSSSRSAYPDSGVSDGYEYEYLGIPLDNAAGPGVKIETGSYVGTGTSEKDNPNTLTFGFIPRMVIIKPDSPTSYYHLEMICGQAQTYSYQGNSNYGKVNISWTGMAVSWYCYSTSYSPEAGQLNNEGTTYHYIAIG